MSFSSVINSCRITDASGCYRLSPTYPLEAFLIRVMRLHGNLGDLTSLFLIPEEILFLVIFYNSLPGTKGTK